MNRISFREMSLPLYQTSGYDGILKIRQLSVIYIYNCKCIFSNRCFYMYIYKNANLEEKEKKTFSYTVLLTNELVLFILLKYASSVLW